MHDKRFKRGFGYIRWSSDQQEDGDTLRRQTDLIETMAARYDVPIDYIFIDEGVSAREGANLKAKWAEMKKGLQEAS